MKHRRLLSGLVLGFTVCFPYSLAFTQITDSDPEITLADESDYITGYHYIWKIPRPVISKLPKWNPTVSEVPLSPHKAVQIATDYLVSTLPRKAKLSILDISLSPQGADQDFKKPELQSIWGYQISFTADPEPPAKDKAGLNVMILLDGTVVKPEVSPLK